jgi:hypothetical protein
MMLPRAPLVPLASAAVLLLLGACNAWQDRAEFAAPQSRWKNTEPSPVAVNAPPPPVALQYCYRTLATVDCFTQAHPERLTGYTGQYPSDIPPAN